MSKSRSSPYRTSQSSSGHEEMDGHPNVMSPMVTGGVALSSAMATTVTTERGVIENIPNSSSSPVSDRDDEGEGMCVCVCIDVHVHVQNMYIHCVHVQCMCMCLDIIIVTIIRNCTLKCNVCSQLPSNQFLCIQVYSLIAKGDHGQTKWLSNNKYNMVCVSYM